MLTVNRSYSKTKISSKSPLDHQTFKQLQILLIPILDVLVWRQTSRSRQEGNPNVTVLS